MNDVRRSSLVVGRKERLTTNDQRQSSLSKIAVLASGRGTNLQAIMDACRRGAIHGEVVVVISTNGTARALWRARRAGLPAILLDHREFLDRETFEAKLVEVLNAYRVELVCLAGWLRILTPPFVAQFEGRIMNIHPALLPLFGGQGMYGDRVHQAVLAAGVKVSGCTVHFVDDTPDGGPIILQATVPVHVEDTPSSLAQRIARREHRLYPQAIRLFAEGRLKIQGHKVRILDPTDGHRASGIGLRNDLDVVGRK